MNLFSRITDQYQELWKAIIRPPRDTYSIDDMGPSVFPLSRRMYQRTDLVVTNNRGQSLACSHFEPIERYRKANKLPCVVYMHGNCSSRVEALMSLRVILPLQVTVFCFDFAGSGHSDGDYVSLGWHERDDLAAVIDHLRNSGRTSTIGLWGRSMGAVTALMHGDRDPSIAGMVLDSPFSNLRTLAEEIVEGYMAWRIPKFLVSSALTLIRNTVSNKAGFDIDLLSPINHVKRSFIPAMFVAAEDDKFILPHHARMLSSQYAGDNHYVTVKGDHNSMRPKYLTDAIAIFFHNTLQCEEFTRTVVPVDSLWTYEEGMGSTRLHRTQSEIPNLAGSPKKQQRLQHRASISFSGTDDTDETKTNCTQERGSCLIDMRRPEIRHCFSRSSDVSYSITTHEKAEMVRNGVEVASEIDFDCKIDGSKYSSVDDTAGGNISNNLCTRCPNTGRKSSVPCSYSIN